MAPWPHLDQCHGMTVQLAWWDGLPGPHLGRAVREGSSATKEEA